MKQGMRKILAVLTMLALVLSLGSALAERQPIVSKPFRIPAGAAEGDGHAGADRRADGGTHRGTHGGTDR